MRLQLISGLVTLLASILPLQDSASPSEQNEPAEFANPLQEMAQWRASQGMSWRVERRNGGYAEMLWGGSAAPTFVPQTDQDRRVLAREFIASTEGIHGVVPESLQALRVDFLPLGQIGSSDKWNVKFIQVIGEVPVADAFVNVLMDDAGNLLSIQSSASIQFDAANTDPFQTSDSASQLALRQFEERSVNSAGMVSAIELVLLPVADGKLFTPRLAWKIDVRPAGDSNVPEAWRFWLDDKNGELLRADDLILNFYDVGGQVKSMATPGTDPDSGANPEAQLSMPNMRVTSSAGTVYTDAAGNFNFPGVSGPLNVTVDYVGTYNDVRNQAGGDYSLTVAAQTGLGNVVVMNPGAQDLVTAEANCYLHVNRCRDWITGVIPTDTHPDFQAVSNANLNDTCNAYYNGTSINMFQAGGGCVNTGFSTVIVHEYGHWLNSIYSTGNGSDGMGEGNADVFAMYLYDDPIVGKDFFGAGSGSNIRDGNNNRQYCGDGNGGCYGQVHADGEPWMGAAWKIRTRLKNTNGVSAGGLTADTLFLTWMNAYNQGTIDSIIEIQWLTLDDDNGNIDDGTPHYSDIDLGFQDQGFPGYGLALISINNVTDLPDTMNGAGPFAVQATVLALAAPPVTTVELFYRVSNGPWVSTPMTVLSGDDYLGQIPGQVSPSTVDYYVSAVDSNSNSTTRPIDAPASFFGFNIGGNSVIYSEDFESAGDNGWTHASFGDTSNNQDDWQHGAPNGAGGDPGSAFSGSQVWGNDLGGSGFNGAYQDNVHSYLRSPAIDCSAALGTKLSLQRWLTVESGQWDQALIKVNGTTVWANDLGIDTIDASWTLLEVDISSIADGNPAVVIEFSLQSDTSVTFGGWNIDDVELSALATGGITDCNNNGVEDALDISSGTSLDCNGNGVPDECELAGNDCNSNGIPDDCDPDCNNNGTPDDCESITDCNSNGLPDECELAGNDCNSNGIPDECDPDCNSNGTPDDCEALTDCNTNGIPDECELAGNDCNSNGVPDECDNDCNNNGTPDDCEAITDCNGNFIPDECELGGNDCNSNGIPDECDEDCNANGTPDDCETLTDCNTNGVPDECELAGNDCNSNGIPDECDPDCNSNGTPDDCETLTDCNTNGVPDECELAGNDCNSNGIPDECDPDCDANGTPDDCETLTDCNTNGVPDECELAGNDCNSNGIPDECDPDCNSNGTPDDCETLTDCNTNGVPDECELAGNDCNSNGIPDDCEPDCNTNGIPDDCETLPDCNSNGVPDQCELAGNDCDANGILDECELGGNDCNSNGILDACDPDCNLNGTPDDCESLTDCNTNGVPDECELAGNDCNSNGIPDECDVDCNANGTPDDCEALTDCNTNGVPDECELAGNDCNSNGIPDECDVDCNANGTPDDCESLTDCNTNGVPDECELAGNDCNSNGIPDECDVDCNANGTPDDCEALTDCNTNGVPDECELAGNDCNSNGIPDECDADCNANGTPDDCEALTDCNANGVPDECDIAAGTSFDANNDGVPDECSFATAYCFGDGSGAACPCANNGAPGEGCANSAGGGALLSASGSASVALDDAVFHGANLLPGQAALLFSGDSQVNGGLGTPFGDGLRCAGGPISRLGVRIPDSNGAAQWGSGFAAQEGWTSGTTRTFQIWYRDSVGSPCGSAFNVSNGLSVTYAP